MATVLLTNFDEVVKRTPLSGNIDPDKFIEYIKIAQEIHIQQLTGTDLLNAIIDMVQAGTLDNPDNSDYKLLVTDYIQPVLNWQSFAEFLPYSRFTVSNKGVFKHTSENSDSITMEELEQMMDKARGLSNFYKQRMSDYLRANNELYPEFFSNTENDINPIPHNSNLDWYLH